MGAENIPCGNLCASSVDYKRMAVKEGLTPSYRQKTCQRYSIRTVPIKGEKGGSASSLQGFGLCEEAGMPTDGNGGMRTTEPSSLQTATPLMHKESGSLWKERVLTSGEMQEVLMNEHLSGCSLKGSKQTPNQDRVVCFALDGPLEIFGLFDGHGETGHEAAEISAELLPKLLVGSILGSSGPFGAHGGPANSTCRITPNVYESSQSYGSPVVESVDSPIWRDAMERAFLGTHRYLEVVTAVVAHNATSSENFDGKQDLVDARMCGTTATVVAMHPPGRLLVAHVGDSRAVLGFRRQGQESSGWQSKTLTRDHKATLPDERKAIEKAGAQITEPGVDRYGPGRVFTPNQTWPAINMSRSIGDLHAHTQGLTAIPEIQIFDRTWDEDWVLIICSDGVWDVMDNQEAVDCVTHPSNRGDPSTALAQEAKRRWEQRGIGGIPGSDSAYMDDVSVIVKFV